MPIHDWTGVNAGLFHDFHQAWVVHLAETLNHIVLPREYFALIERADTAFVENVFEACSTFREEENNARSGSSVIRMTPRVRYEHTNPYAARANRLAVRRENGNVVAIIEIVSPGNKDTARSLKNFVDKGVAFLQQGIHLLIIDLFPPSRRDPEGLHAALWAELEDSTFKLPTDKPLTLASYVAAEVTTAYVETVAVGDELPGMPLFLSPERYIDAPLEATYQETWNAYPKPLQQAVAGRK